MRSQSRRFRKAAAWIAWITRPRPKVRTALRWTLALSFLLHAAVAPLMPGAGSVDDGALRGADTPYGRRLSTRASARYVSEHMNRQDRTPPAPPHPADLICQMQSENIATGIERILDKNSLLDGKIAKQISGNVIRNLKVELELFAEAAASGGMNREELERRQNELIDKSRTQTVLELDLHRKTQQIETAALFTTEWYEQQVSRTLFRNLEFELWTPEGYAGRGKSPEAWSKVLGGEFDGWSRYPNWNDLRSSAHLDRKLQQLEQLSRGEKTGTKTALGGLPAAGAEHAAQLQAQLQQIYKGAIQKGGTHPSPSWRNAVYGDVDSHELDGRAYQTRMSCGVIQEFFPEREEEARAAAARLDEQWEKLLASAAAYDAQAQAGAAAPDLKQAQSACFSRIGELRSAAAPLLPGKAQEARRLLHALARTEVLSGPARERMYQVWSDRMVEGLGPIISDFARSQFKTLKLKADQGFDDAMKEFPAKVLPLLRRDVERLVPRKIFEARVFSGAYPYRTYKNKLGEAVHAPAPGDVRADAALLAETLRKQPELAGFVEKRRELNAQFFEAGIVALTEHIMTRTFSGGLMQRDMYEFVEGPNKEDPGKARLLACEAARKGRGQDLATLNDGVPDTSASQFAFEFGASKGLAGMEPVAAAAYPEHVIESLPRYVLRGFQPAPPGGVEKGGLEAMQFRPEKPAFPDSPRYECIPFLQKVPRLDGDLSEWARIRPLELIGQPGQKPVRVYAGWNYQGFFFAYQVEQSAEKSFPPPMGRGPDPNWAFSGDHFRLLFDTLDARSATRGEPHTQEFVVFPLGTETDAEIPGLERVIASQRDGTVKDFRGIRASGRVFAQQPPAAHGPDGSGPYRVTRADAQGYSVEVFLPRSRFTTPVFAPGWHLGFDCAVAAGFQADKGRRPAGRCWATGNADAPRAWGDLMLLGTDALFVVQDAGKAGTVTQGVIPGHSYLVTVVDADRNVNSVTRDTLLLSAEVQGAGNDVEVYVLKETGPNTGVFRGYINTQPGEGREVHGVLEAQPGGVACLGYVDCCNSRGQRNAIKQIKLPVVHSLLTPRTVADAERPE